MARLTRINVSNPRLLIEFGDEPLITTNLRLLEPVASLMHEYLTGAALRRLSRRWLRGGPWREDARGIIWLDGVGLRFDRPAGVVRVIEAYGMEHNCSVEVGPLASALDRYREAEARWMQRFGHGLVPRGYAYQILLLEGLQVIDSTVPSFARRIDAFTYWAEEGVCLVRDALEERRPLSLRVKDFEVAVHPGTGVVVVSDRLDYSVGPDVLSFDETRVALGQW